MSDTTSADAHLSPLVKQALEAGSKNDGDTALRLYLEAMQAEPQSAIPPFLMAAELAQQGKIADAEAAYANAVLLAPGFAIARFELGVLQFTSGRAAIALVTWQPLMMLADTDPLKLFARGYAELAQDAFAAALDYFEQGMKANTFNPPLNGNIRMLIDAIKRQTNVPENTPPVDSALETEAQSETEQMHFLLSHYKNQGLLH